MSELSFDREVRAVDVGGVRVDPPLWLAPMAGVTDRDFRLIVRRIGGVGVVSMEFVSSKAIVSGNGRTRELMTFSPEERPLAIQIYGSDAATMAEAARVVEELGADVCDINMGCPANKVLKGCAGAALMGDLGLAETIVKAVRRAISIPLTVKFRLGLDDGRRNYLDLGRICQDHGVAAVAMHARTARQMFTGEADWSHLARLKESLAIPVIGNGDVRTADDALRLFAATGCDGVMVGRGATVNPWLFRQIAAHLSRGALAEPTLADRRDLILGHFRLVAERESSRYALHKLRKFTGWYTHGLPNGRRLRQGIQQLPDVASFLAAVEAFFTEALDEAA
jgi:tRNA-dihydrouridine synthase B